MSKLFYKAIIEDIQNHKCTDDEIKNLLDIFESTIKRMATTLARKAWYELKDYATAKQRNLEGFTLMVEKNEVLGQEQFKGTFDNGGKKVIVIGTLERG